MTTIAPQVSVIIPARGLTSELREALPHILAVTPPVLEILVAVDAPVTERIERTRFLVPGATGPAEKRDAAVREARGEIIAFLDDDAYPHVGWIAAALRHFADPSVVAVGGPALTPSHDPLWAQASGAVFSSWLGSGPTRMRHTPVGSVRRIDDWPTVNLLVRREAFLGVGGFDTSYWPGEDTKLCLDLIRRGGVILYDPAARCFHHRATTPFRHLRQVGRYGLHRGHFARVYPETSLRLSYFLPLLVLSVVITLLWTAMRVPSTRTFIVASAVGVFGIVLVSALGASFRAKRPTLLLLFPVLLGATHTTYALAFLRGLFTRSLKRYRRAER